MAGPATDARDADVAAQARVLLDQAASAVAAADAAQREAIGVLIGLWSTSAWLAAGASSAKQWLLAYTSLSYPEAARLERIAELCARHPLLADAVLSGALTLGRADRLAKFVTAEREPFLAEILPALLELAAETTDDEGFVTAVRYWADRVDEHLASRRVQPHSLTIAQCLFGGGTIVAHGTECVRQRRRCSRRLDPGPRPERLAVRPHPVGAPGRCPRRHGPRLPAAQRRR